MLAAGGAAGAADGGGGRGGEAVRASARARKVSKAMAHVDADTRRQARAALRARCAKLHVRALR